MISVLTFGPKNSWEEYEEKLHGTYLYPDAVCRHREEELFYAGLLSLFLDLTEMFSGAIMMCIRISLRLEIFVILIFRSMINSGLCTEYGDCNACGY